MVVSFNVPVLLRESAMQAGGFTCQVSRHQGVPAAAEIAVGDPRPFEGDIVGPDEIDCHGEFGAAIADPVTGPQSSRASVWRPSSSEPAVGCSDEIAGADGQSSS